MINLTTLKLRTFASQKTPFRKWKLKSQTSRIGDVCNNYNQQRIRSQDISRSPTNQYQKTSDFTEKAKNIQRNFIVGKSLMANRHMGRCPAFLIIKKDGN